MNKLILLLVSATAVFSGLVVGGYYLFGVGGAFGGLILCVVTVKFMIRAVKNRFVQLGKALFDSKSRVLRGATAVVHGVTAAPAPLGSDKVEAKAPTRFYFVDVTINAPILDGSTPFACWDPSDLLLVPYDSAPPDINSSEADEQHGPKCEVHEVVYVDESGSAASDQPSPRLKLHVEVPEDTKRLKFQYYFETFGDLAVP